MEYLRHSETCGPYTRSICSGIWTSSEFFCKLGEVRVIGNKLHFNCSSVGITRYWREVESSDLPAINSTNLFNHLNIETTRISNLEKRKKKSK